MKGFAVLDTENRVATGSKPCMENAMKASSGKAERKKLADISNLPQQTRALEHDGKSPFMPITVKEYIDQLQNENVALTKILAERNKLVEVTEIELKKLRANLQKMRQQNLELAQSNSQMLVDLNSGKDRLKTLQHELGCQKGLLKAKTMEVQVNQIDYEATEKSKIGGNGDKLGNTQRRPQLKSLGPSLQVQSTDTNENKRPCMERQSARFECDKLKLADGLFSVCQQTDDPLQESVTTSACTLYRDENREEDDAPVNEVENKRPYARRRSDKFKSEGPKFSEDLSEKQDAKSPICLLSEDDKVQENGLSSTCSLENEEAEGIPASVYEAQVFSKSSVSRPSRQAAKKVQTYKEIPLNKKMRRTE